MMTYLVLVLQFVCLALWVGGTTVLLVIVAPSSSRIKSFGEAREMMLLILKRFHGLLVVLQLLLLATLSLQLLLLSGSVGLKLRLALSLVSIGMLLTVHFRYTVLPRLASRDSIEEEERSNPGEARSVRSHERSATLLANLFLGISVVIILILPF